MASIELGNHVIGGRERAKHVDIRKHFAHEAIQNKEIRLIKIDSSAQLANRSLPGHFLTRCSTCIQGIVPGFCGIEEPSVIAVHQWILLS